MGIHDLTGVPDKNNGANHPYRTYPHSKWEDKLNEWFDDLEQKFPEEIKCDFIEVSSRIKRANAKAFYRDGGKYTFLRFSQSYLECEQDDRIKMTLLHEMVHLYTYQHDKYQISDSSAAFKWLCGRVGAPINQVSTDGDTWNEIMQPMIED